MSESAIKRTLARGVGRQIFSFFLVAAIVPMMFTVWLAWSEFSRGLEGETSRILKDNAKEYGIEVLTRLQLASEKAAEIVRIANDGGLEAINGHEYLLDDFEAVWIVGDNVPPTMSLQDSVEAIELGPAERAFLASGETKLVLSSQGSLIM